MREPRACGAWWPATIPQIRRATAISTIQQRVDLQSASMNPILEPSLIHLACGGPSHTTTTDERGRPIALHRCARACGKGGGRWQTGEPDGVNYAWRD